MTIELHSAWVWDCPECGTENFCRCVRAELTREEAIDMARKLGEIPDGVEPHEDFCCEFLTQPDEVTCRECQNAFDTECVEQ